MKVKTMKINTYSTHSAILLLMVSLLFSAFVAGQAVGADPRSPHTVAQSQAPAHLIIKRNPNLGVNVIVRLWIDGQPAGSIGYGHTYRGFLTPGHHILAVLASPNPRWPVPWQLPLDVRSGQTYGFTAVTDGSGTLILDGRFGFPPRVQ
ncbi:MAG: hypothetical protein DME90_03035 [Verrucomicrobia bacterium]|nr:MAG: hypothetical protein DME90_03035 [Verrucomicrobiota bacterium]